MSNPYVGEIRLFAGNFAPQNWMFCNGQSVSINEYEALFALIGTTYGGNGSTTFGLPNLQGRLPLHQGSNQFSTYSLGEQAGQETVTLLTNQMPFHTHPVIGSSADGSSRSPAGNVPALSTRAIYAPVGTGPTGAMASGTVGSAGISTPHTNLMPYQCINYIIAMDGIFPTQN